MCFLPHIFSFSGRFSSFPYRPRVLRIRFDQFCISHFNSEAFLSAYLTDENPYVFYGTGRSQIRNQLRNSTPIPVLIVTSLLSALAKNCMVHITLKNSSCHCSTKNVTFSQKSYDYNLSNTATICDQAPTYLWSKNRCQWQAHDTASLEEVIQFQGGMHMRYRDTSITNWPCMCQIDCALSFSIVSSAVHFKSNVSLKCSPEFFEFPKCVSHQGVIINLRWMTLS